MNHKRKWPTGGEPGARDKDGTGKIQSGFYDTINTPVLQYPGPDTLVRAGYLAGNLANFYKFHGRKLEADQCYAIEDSLLQVAADLEGGQP